MNSRHSEHAPLTEGFLRARLVGLFGLYGVMTLMLVMCLVVWTTVERYMDPQNEKYVYTLAPGGADFFFAFGGARALLLGANPYHNDIAGLEDPWKQEYLVINGEQVRGNYPPTHFILYLPLAMLTDNFREAGRILFVINLASLLGLSYVTWQLIATIGNLHAPERRFSMLLIPVIFIVLACNPATGLALERGNGGDIWAALFCWSAILMVLNRWYVPAMFILVPAALVKGYAVLCAFGIGLLGLRKQSWGQTVAGTLLGLTVFLLPIVRYIPDALEIRRAILASTDQVDWLSLWWNHGFRNVLKQLAPDLPNSAWIILAGVCAAIAVASWIKTRQAEREGRIQDRALWMVLFATSSLELMLGSNPQSLIYNLILILPGLMIVMMLVPTFARACALPKGSVHALGVLNLAAASCIFKFELFDFYHFPLPGIGIIIFLVTVGGAMFVGGFYSRHLMSLPVAHLGAP